MQRVLLGMRMVCDSTYLIDRKHSNISEAQAELEGTSSMIWWCRAAAR
jgi:hypothetical protein